MNNLLASSLASFLLLSACSSDGDSPPTLNGTALACTFTAEDSTYNSVSNKVVRIHSETNGSNTYQQILNVRGTASIDYMVHANTSVTNTKALLVLIAGGQLNAQISGVIGQSAASASGNFLVRSAHLFAAQGYKVITVDRPSDYASFFAAGVKVTSGRALDPYRTSAAHFNDLQAIISAENKTSLPVVIAGTSRGAISAVAQHRLAEYVMLSAPVTSGNGSPVGSAAVSPSDVGNKPVHMIWHQNDGCFVSTPSGASAAAGGFSNATAFQVSGGINHPELSTKTKNKGCDGSKTFHGFLGIEACVVKNATDWLGAQLKGP